MGGHPSHRNPAAPTAEVVAAEIKAREQIVNAEEVGNPAGALGRNLRVGEGASYAIVSWRHCKPTPLANPLPTNVVGFEAEVGQRLAAGAARHHGS